MNISEWLGYADIYQLNRIAQRLNCTCDSHSKQQLIQSILFKMKKAWRSDSILYDLTKEELLFMNLLIFDKREFLSFEELMGKAKLSTAFTSPSHNARSLVTGFLANGWLFKGIQPHTLDLFQMPEDLKEALIQRVRSMLHTRVEDTAQPPLAYRDEGKAILEDIVTFLDFVQTEEPPVTSERVIYKRQQHQLFSRFHVLEQPLNRAGWRFGYGYHFRDYPNRFSLIYDYCYFFRLVDESYGKLTLTERGRQALEEKKFTLLQVVQLWLRVYQYPIPLLPVLVHLIALMCEKRWVQCTSALALLRPWIRPFYFDEPKQVFQLRIIEMMVHLGLLQLGDVEGQQVIHLTSIGKEIMQARSLQTKATPVRIDLQKM